MTDRKTALYAAVLYALGVAEDYDGDGDIPDLAEVALAHLRNAGFVIVPVEATKAMVDASADQYDFGDGDLAEIQARVRIEEDINTYRAMIEAAQEGE